MMKRKPDSDYLKDAATLLLKGGTLINDPCPTCSGLQVRFQDENICVDECQRHLSTYDQSPASTASHASLETVKKMIDAIINEKLVAVLQSLRQENDFSEQKIKAELIEIYMRILSRLEDDDKVL